jgi:hypothetical protein
MPIAELPAAVARTRSINPSVVQNAAIPNMVLLASSRYSRRPPVAVMPIGKPDDVEAIRGLGPERSPWIWTLVALNGGISELAVLYDPAVTITSSLLAALVTASFSEQGLPDEHSVPEPPGDA